MPRHDLPDELWVIEPFKSHESKAAGFAIGRVKLKGDAVVVGRYRRKLKRRIRSINERRLADLAASNPSSVFNHKLEAQNEILEDRIAALEAELAKLREQ